VIRHTVVFSLKHKAGSAEEKAFIEAGKRILPAIPGVKKFEALRQVKKGTDYDFGFSMEFDDQAAYDAYNIHPAHQDFVQNRWMKEVSRFMEIDYLAV
jgi:hypothetical protein